MFERVESQYYNNGRAMNKYSTPQQPDNDKAQGSEYQIQVYNSNKLE